MPIYVGVEWFVEGSGTTHILNQGYFKLRKFVNITMVTNTFKDTEENTKQLQIAEAREQDEQ